MRIAVFHDLPSGGAKRALRQQVLGLSARGHNVRVYVPSTAEERFSPLSGAASDVRVFPRPVQPDREEALERGLSPAMALRWVRYLAAVHRSEREIAAEIDAGAHDAVLVAASQFTQAPWVLRFLRTPTLYFCQEPLRAAYEPRVAPPITRIAIRGTIGRVDLANTRAASLVAVNSHFSARRIRRIYGRSGCVNYLGVDADQFRPLRSSPRGEYVLTVGALHPLKGLDFLLDVFACIPAAMRPPLVVVSDRARDAERRRLEQSATRYGVDLSFRFSVSEDELVSLYNAARLVVYAPYDEPFGFVPLEAMACGRPVLGIREGGIPETVVEGETGFIAPRDVGVFADRVVDLLTHQRGTDEVARRAREIVRTRWTWDESVNRLEWLLKAAAGRKR